MILFIAPNPHKIKEHEGFLKRVAAVDVMFSNHKRYYYDDLSDDKERAKVLSEADLIYVHSIYSAKHILITYPFLADRIITDLHGAVPEEEEFAGNEENARIMAEVEAKVFKFGVNFIAVSEAMVEHFQKKYKQESAKKWIVLPIFDDLSIIDLSRKKYNKKVVYAGGIQKWQNVDKMIDAVNKADSYEYVILTHQPKAFASIHNKENVTIKTVPSAEVHSYYRDASYGFMLRDDTVLNRVACPTKLIEYMCNGVIPIVLSPNIGDAQALGFKYITLDSLLTKDINVVDIESMAADNIYVLQKLRRQSDKGRKSIATLAVKMVERKYRAKNITPDSICELLTEHSQYEREVHENWALTHENARLQHEGEVLRHEVTQLSGSKTRSTKIRHILSKTKHILGK